MIKEDDPPRMYIDTVTDEFWGCRGPARCPPVLPSKTTTAPFLLAA